MIHRHVRSESSAMLCRPCSTLVRTIARQPRLNSKPRRSKLLCRATKNSIKVTVHTPAGDELQIDKGFFSIGSAGGSDLFITGNQVAEEHACIEVKNGRLYCTALVGDPDYFLDDTFTWLNDSELRPGEQGQQYTLQFDEKSGPDPLGDMLMKGMLSQASLEVQKKMAEDA